MKANKVGFTSQCHPELDSGSRCLDSQSGEMPNQVWHDTSFGFTLVELLVVVLIIGILTAIGLPQYQRAVSKAQMTEALTNLAILERAEQACVLANKRVNNTNCTSMDNLDVKVANSNNWTYAVSKSSGCSFAPSGTTTTPTVCAYEPGVQLDASDNGIPWLSSYKPRSNGAWIRTCHATNKAQEKVCEGLSQFGFGAGGYYSSSSSSGYYGSSSSGYFAGYCSGYNAARPSSFASFLPSNSQAWAAGADLFNSTYSGYYGSWSSSYVTTLSDGFANWTNGLFNGYFAGVGDSAYEDGVRAGLNEYYYDFHFGYYEACRSHFSSSCLWLDR